jgi:hypothetical protein
VCVDGLCERVTVATPEFCMAADAGESVGANCPTPVNTCLEAACRDGRCAYDAKPDGASCTTHVGAPGRCESGSCAIDEAAATEKERKCREVVRRTYYGPIRQTRCKSGLRYRIPWEELQAIRDKISETVEKEVRYDMAVGLIAQPGGGYNINLYNTRTRDEVRGLVDPSFVAFSLASYTAGTDWKSRMLNVWLEPMTEGWTIPTSGGRKALKKGRQANALGLFGVVDVRTYRKWLESAFRPMPSAVAVGIEFAAQGD